MKDDIKNLYTTYVNGSEDESEKAEEELMTRFRSSFSEFYETPEDDVEFLFALGLLQYTKDNANN